MQIQKSGFPFERIAIYILEELPMTDNGNKYVLVVSDYYTKWTESFTMPNMEATTVAGILVTDVITRFGVPNIIHSDHGSQFESQLFTEMCRLLQISKPRTSPYHPQSDGMVERFNKTLATMPSAYVNDHHSNWDTLIPYVMMAYRSSIHETTGCTPNRLMLGREVSTPVDLMYQVPASIKRVPQNRWVWELQEWIEEAHAFVQKHINESMQRQKKIHDKRLNWCLFEEGDKVFVFFPTKKPGHSPKFTSFWRGPYEIKKRCSEVNYLVICGRRGRAQVIHIDRMLPCKPQQLQGDSYMNERDEEPYLVESNQTATPKPEILPENTEEIDSNEDEVVTGFKGSSCDRTAECEGVRPRRDRKLPTYLRDYEL